MLARFIQIDYYHSIALVTLDEASENTRMLCIARIIGDPDEKLSLLGETSWF
jgi:hypothetical protein